MAFFSKYQTLLSVIRQYPSAAVAFSGGVDSSLLCRAVYDALGSNSLAVTVLSPLIPQREADLARKTAASVGIPHKIITIPELNPVVTANPPDRCYHCKKIIFDRIISAAAEEGISVVFDGSNKDDLQDYRPGLRALRELKVVSPLQEAGLSKEEIRELSRQLELETWDLPAYACLASRIPYHSVITKEKLTMVEKGEDSLHGLGFRQIRLRHHGEIARLEVSREERSRIMDPELMDRISGELKQLGFTYVCLELEGYRMGSLNKSLKEKELNDER